MKYCDLHTHSACSDGSLTPTQLIRLAEKQGLSAIALTDHNTIKGLPEFLEAGQHSDVITVPGCEFTTAYNGQEAHVLGLFLRESAWPAIAAFTERMRLSKETNNQKLIAALQKGGYNVTYAEAAAYSDADTFNRSNVACALVAKGYFETIQQAFSTVLKEGNGYYAPSERLDALDTVRFIKSHGGKAVLAHPFLNFSSAELIGFLPQAKEAGLDGMETLYSTYTREQSQEAAALAAQFGLLPSGGSDFHGGRKPNIRLGSGCGNLRVPFSFYEALKD